MSNITVDFQFQPTPIVINFGGASGGGGAAIWGGITGTLSNQTDLQAALNAKLSTLANGSGTTWNGGTLSVNLGGSLTQSAVMPFGGNFVFSVGASSTVNSAYLSLSKTPGTSAYLQYGITGSTISRFIQTQAVDTGSSITQLTVASNGTTSTTIGLSETGAYLNASTGQSFTVTTSGVALTLNSDATGDIYRRNSGGLLQRLPLGTALQVLRVNAGATDIEWGTGGGGGSGTVTNVSSATAELTITNPTTTPQITIVSAPKLTTGRTIGITGDVTYTSPAFDGSGNVTAASTVTRINSTALSGLATGILKNTTGTGVPSIAAAGTDYQVPATTLAGYGILNACNKFLTANRQTASYQIVLSDAGSGVTTSTLVEMNVAGANNLTIPLNATTAFPIGSVINVTQYGAGVTTVVPTGGVTIRSSSGLFTIPSQYSIITLEKVGTDEWYLWNGTPLTANAFVTVTSVSSVGNATASGIESIYLGDTTSGGFTTTLPTAVGITGQKFTMKKIVAANTWTIGTTSSQTIDGSTTAPITLQYLTLTVVSDGANWQVI